MEDGFDEFDAEEFESADVEATPAPTGQQELKIAKVNLWCLENGCSEQPASNIDISRNLQLAVWSASQ